MEQISQQCIMATVKYINMNKNSTVLGKLVHALDGHTVCVEVGAALGKLVAGLDGVTVCLHHDK